MAGMISKFNINNTATMHVDIAYAVSGARVYHVTINTGIEQKSIYSVLPKDKASQVRKALDFLINEKAAESATTESGLTVYRGAGNDE